MRKLLTFIVIIIILFPMCIYLNPFMWGMNHRNTYTPSINTSILISNLNNKYRTNIFIGEVSDTLWYFRDLKTRKISQQEHFILELYDKIYTEEELQRVINFTEEFKHQFEHKLYYDSIIVAEQGGFSIYKTRMQ